MVRFVESNEIGVPPKRKQVSNACDSCRKRKKRCSHHNAQRDDSPISAPGSEARSEQAPVRGINSTTILGSSTARTSLSQSVPPPLTSAPLAAPPSVSRASAEISPLLPTPSSAPPAVEDDTHKARFVGDTNPEGLLVEAVSPRSKRDSSHRGGVGTWISNPAASHPPQMTLSHRGLEQVILPYVRNICLKVIPPPVDYLALQSIYREKIHPLFPVFDDASFQAHDDSPSTCLMKQVISLAAGTDGAAGPHLRFESSTPTLSHAEFSTTLTSAIRAVVDSGIINDRLILAQCLSLLSLYIQPQNPEEPDLPALISAKAIHHAHTMAVQIKGKGDDQDREMERLFLCTWTLDRLTGAFYGRPCLMHERDFGRNVDEAIARQNAPFRLFLIVIQFLEGVISLYRPGAPECDFFNLGALEELIVRAGASRIPAYLIATIETFYNGVIILSCRVPSPGHDGRDVVPIPAASCRRSLAADRIAFVVGKEFKGQLSPLPIVPYSVSLALSVAYRKMRFTQIPMYWHRAKGFFATNCALLHSLGDIFWSARALATLGDRVLLEMEKAMSNMLIEQGEVSGSSSTSNRQIASGSETQGGVGANTFVASNDGTSSTLANSEFDFGSFQPDVDLFGHMDPRFNLDAVDAALEANLDLGLQVNWMDWGDFSA